MNKRRILLSMGNIERRYPNVSKSRIERILSICKNLGKELSACKDIEILHGGRTQAISSSVVNSLSKSFIDEALLTYLPKTEIDNTYTTDEYLKLGSVFEKGSYAEERREHLVNDADIVIATDGNRGVREMFKLAKLRGKKLIPLCFGIEDDNYLVSEAKNFGEKINETKDSKLIRNWRIINSLSSKPSEVAKSIVYVLKSYLSGQIREKIFVTLPLIPEAEARMDDVRGAIKTVATEYKFEDVIVVDTDGEKPLIEDILLEMDKAVAIISILDFNRPNIYFESGYMKGQGKPVILCCHESDFANVAFDTKAFEIIVWKSVEGLKKSLRARLNILLSKKILFL